MLPTMALNATCTPHTHYLLRCPQLPSLQPARTMVSEQHNTQLCRRSEVCLHKFMVAVRETQREGESQHACSPCQPAEESHLLGVTESAKVLQALYNGGVKRLHRSCAFGKQPPAQRTDQLSDPFACHLVTHFEHWHTCYKNKSRKL